MNYIITLLSIPNRLYRKQKTLLIPLISTFLMLVTIGYCMDNPEINAQLIVAIKENNLGRVKSLISQGANPNTVWSNPKTLNGTFQLPEGQQSELIGSKRITGKEPPSALMISLGILALDDPDWSKWLGKFDDFAVQHKEITLSLIRAGANVNIKDVDTGETPLHIASHILPNEVVSLLLEKGARVDDKDKFGLTPLMAAMISKEDHLERVNILLKYEANVNTKSKDGTVPLLCVHGPSRLKYVRLLVSHGANINAKDKKGQSVLKRMKLSRNSLFPIDLDTIALLRKLGATE